MSFTLDLTNSNATHLFFFKFPKYHNDSTSSPMCDEHLHHCHSVGPINTNLIFSQFVLSRIYIVCIVDCVGLIVDQPNLMKTICKLFETNT